MLSNHSPKNIYSFISDNLKTYSGNDFFISSTYFGDIYSNFYAFFISSHSNKIPMLELKITRSNNCLIIHRYILIFSICYNSSLVHKFLTRITKKSPFFVILFFVFCEIFCTKSNQPFLSTFNIYCKISSKA